VAKGAVSLRGTPLQSPAIVFIVAESLSSIELMSGVLDMIDIGMSLPNRMHGRGWRLAATAQRSLVRVLAALSLAAISGTASGGDWGSIQLLKREIPAGASQRFPFVPDETFESPYLNTPVFIARGLWQDRRYA
jgi:hypothetical protein